MRPILALLLSWLSASALAGSVNPVDLRCEYNVNPLGIDSASPRLFWKLAVPTVARGRRHIMFWLRVVRISCGAAKVTFGIRAK